MAEAQYKVFSRTLPPRSSPPGSTGGTRLGVGPSRKIRLGFQCFKERSLGWSGRFWWQEWSCLWRRQKNSISVQWGRSLARRSCTQISICSGYISPPLPLSRLTPEVELTLWLISATALTPLSPPSWPAQAISPPFSLTSILFSPALH